MNASPRPNDESARVRTRASLLGRLKDLGEGESWRDFFDTYWALLYRFAISKGLSETESEDVVQDTVVVVAKRIKDFEYKPKEARFSTWLCAIANYQILKCQSRRRSTSQAAWPETDAGADIPLLDQIPDPASLEQDALWQREWELNVLAVATDSAKQKANAEDFQRYEYHVIQGHTAEDTAGHLGCKVNTVYSAKHRLLKLIKGEVERLRQEAY